MRAIESRASLGGPEKGWVFFLGAFRDFRQLRFLEDSVSFGFA